MLLILRILINFIATVFVAFFVLEISVLVLGLKEELLGHLHHDRHLDLAHFIFLQLPAWERQDVLSHELLIFL